MTAAVRLVPMELQDIQQVVAIDRLAFPLPWSEAAYRHELAENPAAHFIVALASPPAEAQPAPRHVVGYTGFWFIIDEAHINNLAVHPNWRRQGIGAMLVQALLQRALAVGATVATLEVRVGNLEAQALYRKYGFEVVGRRKQYYHDNFEDALLMTASLQSG